MANALTVWVIKMALKFKDKTAQRKTKTLIYGLDGVGKSTAAELYCQKRGLKPVCIDVDDTNYTNVPILDVNFNVDKNIALNIKNVILDIARSDEYDTLIIDGVGSLLELLTPTAIKDQRAYLIRSQEFKKIWKCLLKANVNIIFVGQKDLIVTEENESSKLAERINNMVDWKYWCYKTKDGEFKNECTKWRGKKEELY